MTWCDLFFSEIYWVCESRLGKWEIPYFSQIMAAGNFVTWFIQTYSLKRQETDNLKMHEFETFERMWSVYLVRSFPKINHLFYVLTHCILIHIDSLAFLKSDILMFFCVAERTVHITRCLGCTRRKSSQSVVPWSLPFEQKKSHQRVNFLEILRAGCGVDIASQNLESGGRRIRSLKPQRYSEFKFSLEYMCGILS